MTRVGELWAEYEAAYEGGAKRSVEVTDAEMREWTEALTNRVGALEARVEALEAFFEGVARGVMLRVKDLEAENAAIKDRLGELAMANKACEWTSTDWAERLTALEAEDAAIKERENALDKRVEALERAERQWTTEPMPAGPDVPAHPKLR